MQNENIPNKIKYWHLYLWKNKHSIVSEAYLSCGEEGAIGETYVLPWPLKNIFIYNSYEFLFFDLTFIYFGIVREIGKLIS